MREKRREATGSGLQGEKDVEESTTKETIVSNGSGLYGRCINWRTGQGRVSEAHAGDNGRPERGPGYDLAA